ncbi:MAG: hypothetical protein ABI655_08605 [Phenylobacterium sp.]
MSFQRKSLTAALLGAAGLTLFIAGPAAAGQCRDPWVTQAIQEVTGRPPNGDHDNGECAYTLYNGGHWNSYAELKNAVNGRLGTRFAPASGPRTMSMSTFNSLQKTDWNGQKYALYAGKWMKIVASGGGNYTLISNDGASIVTNATGN